MNRNRKNKTSHLKNKRNLRLNSTSSNPCSSDTSRNLLPGKSKANVYKKIKEIIQAMKYSSGSSESSSSDQEFINTDSDDGDDVDESLVNC